jgi:alpha-tubulin suppressor-like RCC1 family protein
MINAVMVAYSAAMPTRLSGLLAAVAVIGPLSSVPAAPHADAPKRIDFVVGWGANFYGELGDGTTTDSATPVFAAVPEGPHFTTVRCQLFGLALSSAGQVFTWGNNSSGQLGDGTTTQRLKPVRARLPAGVKVTAVRAGSDFVLALTSTGKILAWGDNTRGELGDGTTRGRKLPVTVRLPQGVTVKAISAGDDNGLALTSTGRLLAWGGNEAGQLGDGTTKRRLRPVSVHLPAHTTVSTIAAGDNVGLATTSAGQLLAWGANGQGTLGDGTTKSRSIPGQVHLPKGTKVVAATAGELHVMAITTTGQVLAWGNNEAGQLGDGTTTDRLLPVRVRLPAETKVRALAGGKFFSLAMTAGHRILAWGDNHDGQLGSSTLKSSDVPVPVPLPKGFTPTAIGAGTVASTALAIGNAVPD